MTIVHRITRNDIIRVSTFASKRVLLAIGHSDARAKVQITVNQENVGSFLSK